MSKYAAEEYEKLAEEIVGEHQTCGADSFEFYFIGNQHQIAVSALRMARRASEGGLVDVIDKRMRIEHDDGTVARLFSLPLKIRLARAILNHLHGE